MANNVIEIILRAKDQASGALKGATNSLGGLKTAIGAIAAGVSFKKIIDGTIEAQEAVAQLGVAYAQSGEAAKRSQREILEFSAAAQKSSIFSDEAVTRAQTTLLRFGRVTGEVFERTRESILDVSSALKIDLESAASTVGRALESPTQGMRQLRQLGIIFTESQRKVIKSLEDTGQSAKAQEIILEALERRFGGAAAAARNTLGGALQALKNAFGELFESTEAGANDAAKAVNKLADIISDPKTKENLQSLVGFLVSFFSKLVDIVNEAIRGWQFLLELMSKSSQEKSNLDRLFEKQANLGDSLNNAMAQLDKARQSGSKVAEASANRLIERIKSAMAELSHQIEIARAVSSGDRVAGTSRNRKGSGLTFVPQSELDRINEAAEQRRLAEQEALSKIEHGSPVNDQSYVNFHPFINEESLQLSVEQYEAAVEAIEEATEGIPDIVDDALKRSNASVDNFVDSFKRAWEDVINTGKFSFKSFVQSFIAELSKKAIFNAIDKIGKALSTALSASGGGGGFLGSIGKLFGFAGGGRPSGFATVGEEGPELAYFGSGGKVWNQRQLAFMGGGGATVNYTPVYNVTIEARDAEEAQRRMIAFFTLQQAKDKNELIRELKENGVVMR